MPCIRFEKMVEVRLTVANMRCDIMDRQIFRKMFSHIANGFEESALIGRRSRWQMRVVPPLF